MAVSIIFYLFYFILCLVVPFASIYKVNKKVILIVILFVAQFNATAFFRVGITIGFFEIAILITFICLLIKYRIRANEIFISGSDKVFISFLFFSILSIIISSFRIFFKDLIPSNEYDTSPAIRSIMSLNKVIIFVPVLLFIRNYIYRDGQQEQNKNTFFYILALSGIIPSIAVILQSLNIGFQLIHNNPSFGEISHIETYNNIRPVGLSNEASFFAYSLFFSYMGVIEVLIRDNKKRRAMIGIILFYWIALVLTISRTGMLIFIVYSVYKFFSIQSFKPATVIKFAVIVIITGTILSNITIHSFNLADRFLSSFNVEADASTIERFGVTDALSKLLIDKSKILGIGIYDYGYYIKPYLPYYMNSIYYKPGESPPSFNFILQLIAELGPLLFIGMIASIIFVLKKADRFVKEWFMFLVLFALSFQILNFSIPFLILLYPTKKRENIIYN